MSTAGSGEVRLRADAARNRQLIIDTARHVYRQRGLDAPLDEIARTAGIGNATVYRHFPTRCALVAAAFGDVLRRVIGQAEEALLDPDPWAGFAGHVTFLCRMQATDRGLADLLTTQATAAPELEELRGRAYRALVRLADRARAAGALRADFVPQDLVLVLMANAGLVHRTAEAAPQAWHRFSDLVLDGLRSSAAAPAAPPPSAMAVRRAMRQRGDSLGYS
jgi:AcrR family transcriptional regulator